MSDEERRIEDQQPPKEVSEHHEEEAEREEEGEEHESRGENVPEKEAETSPAPESAAPVAKSEEKKDTEHINLKVVGQDGTSIFFKIKKHTSLRRLIDAYCQRQGVATNAIRFLFDGRRIQPDQTPKDLGMEDGDIIDAMLFQTGGSAF